MTHRCATDPAIVVATAPVPTLQKEEHADRVKPAPQESALVVALRMQVPAEE